jgi:hypothetical protein
MVWKAKSCAYVKVVGSNLNIMTIALKFIMINKVLSLDENFQNNCFGHVFFKACQHVITN